MKNRRQTPLFWAVALTACLGQFPAQAGEGVLQFAQSQRARQYSAVPREILAFYYTWYGLPEQHWGRIDAPRHDIAESTHYPQRGAYDSRDPQVIDEHIRLAQEHGVTGFIATWWGQGHYVDGVLPALFDRADARGFHVSLYWETAPGRGDEQIDRAVSDLTYLLTTYGHRKSFLKVDGRPVIFVYGRVMEQVPLVSWAAIVRRAREQAGDFALIADGFSPTLARLFDGLHTYNICDWTRDKPPDTLREASRKVFGESVLRARQLGRISCLTVIPGYDDTKIRKPGLRSERYDGAAYRVLWEEAMRADPDWVLITSWNEWHEGSEIEPSWQHGDRYLQLTGELAARFRSLPPHVPREVDNASAIHASQRAQLQPLFAGRTIGLLPGFRGELPFWLVEVGLPVQELSWDDVIDPQRLNPQRISLLMHCGDEGYRARVQHPDDVALAMEQYLAAGGFLASIPAAPFPFYYDMTTGRARPIATRLGLPIHGGWEQPPGGTALTLHFDTQALPGLPATVPFPTSGDRRWRPASEKLTPGAARYLPLATLRDASGQSLGDGLVYLEHTAPPLAPGRTFYAWMRTPELLGHDGLTAIMRFLGEHLP